MTLLEQTPQFSTADAERFANKLFGCEVTEQVQALPSERDQNFRVLSSDGDFVLKISNASESKESLIGQNELIGRVFATMSGVRLFESVSGNQIESVKGDDGTNYFVRMVSYVDGETLAGVSNRSDELLSDLGRAVAQMTNSLEGFEHPSFHREFHWDLANAVAEIESRLELVRDESKRSLIAMLVAKFKKHTQPLLSKLPQSIIHNDANDGNVIIASDDGHVVPNRVAAVIDFGDSVWSWTVGDLAVAIAYGILDQSDPVEAMNAIVKGYLSQRPLLEEESQALFGLVCMRLCVSIVMAEEQQSQRPEDPYLSVSQGPIARTLPKLAEVPFQFAAAMISAQSNHRAFEHSERVEQWLRSRSSQFVYPVGNSRPEDTELLVMDLGVESPHLDSGEGSIKEPALTQVIDDAVEAASAKFAIGRYLEPRLIYDSELFRTRGFASEPRTIHLGMDVFAPAGFAVRAPLAGEVFAYAYNDRPLDYGGVIVLKHQTDFGDTFYSLYGHLSRSSLEELSVGQAVAAGEAFATLGEVDENGGWPPHLHFQLITDEMGLGTEFPGVCRGSRVATWRQFCPDPNLILEIPAELFPREATEKSKTLSNRTLRIGGNLSIGYHEPVKAVRGWKHFLYDENGRKYLDAYNNVPHVGHCHPRVVEAMNRQARRLNTNTRYLSDDILEYADALAATMPDGLEVCYFVNSASEANELALRMARAKTGGKDLIVLEGAYHGHSTSLIDISPYKHDGPGGSGAPDWVHTAPVADIYRGEYRDPDSAGKHYSDALDAITTRLANNGKQLCGFIAESCPSVGGQIVFPPNYLTSVYAHVRKAGGVCIADDVQTGYGRLGKWFYGFEQQQVVPDMVVLGKPIGNGHPIAAVVTTREIADAFDNGMEYFSTFGGNNVSAVVGKTVLDIVRDESLPEKAAKVGDYLLTRFADLKEKHPIIGDVRGSGLFLGIELVRDCESLEPADREASFVSNRMRERGILLGTDGPLHNVVKIRPPMTFGMSEAEVLADELDLILSEL